MVAVLISPGHGAGWSTWAGQHHANQVLFDPWIADVLLSDQYTKKQKHQRIQAHCAVKYPDMYLGGLDNLMVEWVPNGTEFIVNEYDGSEHIELKQHIDWITA